MPSKINGREPQLANATQPTLINGREPGLSSSLIVQCWIENAISLYMINLEEEIKHVRQVPVDVWSRGVNHE